MRQAGGRSWPTVRRITWSIHQGYFKDFVPIVDLLHVVCYLFKTAHAVEEEPQRWPL